MNATLDTVPLGHLDSAPIGVGRAHAKTILVGEHAVVYGAPAIAIPVPDLTTVVHAVAGQEVTLNSDLHTGPVDQAPKRLGPVITAISAALNQVRAQGVPDVAGVEVTISSDIPPDRGLGSSAAVAAAIAQAVAGAYHTRFDDSTRFAIAQQAERHAHGNPSGLDTHTVMAGAPIRFSHGGVEPIKIKDGFHLVLADSGVPGSTATAVAGVKTLFETDLGTAHRSIDALSALTTEVGHALSQGDLAAVGEAMTQAHEHLRTLGVSIPELNNLVAQARKAGALGAKLTGGGLGGCVLALTPTAKTAHDVAAALHSAGATRVWQLRVDQSC